MRLLSTGQLDAEPALRPRVAFVIRTYNEERLLDRCLARLEAQCFSGAGELVIVDSGSSDATLDIASRYPARVIQIQPESFSYSHALNLGVASTRAPLIVSLSAHVVPLRDDWLRELTRHFQNARVAGVHGREVAWPDADAFERYRLSTVFGDQRQTRTLEAIRPGTERVADYAFSNACSCFRRALWELRPFRELPYAEDLDWARWAILAGHQIVYEPQAPAYHSHREPLTARARREYCYERARATIFDRALRPLRTSVAYLVGSGRFVAQALREEPFSAVPGCMSYAAAKWLYLNWLLATHRDDPSPRPPRNSAPRAT